MLENNLVGPVAPRDIFHAHRRRRASIKHLACVTAMWFSNRTEPFDAFQLADNPISVGRKKCFDLPRLARFRLYDFYSPKSYAYPYFLSGFRLDEPIIYLSSTQTDTI